MKPTQSFDRVCYVLVESFCAIVNSILASALFA
jgi:hypothetical protein